MLQPVGNSGASSSRTNSRSEEDSGPTSNSASRDELVMATLRNNPNLPSEKAAPPVTDTSVAYQYAAVQQMLTNRNHIEYQLTVREQPKQSRMCGIGEKADRRPIDPAPIVQLRVITHDQPIEGDATAHATPGPPPVSRKAGQGPSTPSNPDVRGGAPVSTSLGDGWEDKAWYLENPYYFMYAMLCHNETDEELHLLNDGKTRYTSGSCVSCLYHLKDIDGSHQGFFVFPDLSIRVEGRYRLKLCLFEIIGQSVHHCKSIYSDPFHVFTAKRFPGMEESTRLSRSFAEQGLKVRVRKHPRSRRRDSKRQKDDSDASDGDQLATGSQISANAAKKARPSDSSDQPAWTMQRSPGELSGHSTISRTTLSPELVRHAPVPRTASTSWNDESSRPWAASGRDHSYDHLERGAMPRDERMVGYGLPAPEGLYRDPYAIRERTSYQRPIPRIDPRQDPRRELTRMAPPAHLTRSSDFASPYDPAYGRGVLPSSRGYERLYPQPDYMTYDERRAFEDFHVRARVENPGPQYDLRAPHGYGASSVPPSPDASADAQNRLSRPIFRGSEHRPSDLLATAPPHMDRMYSSRLSPPRPDLYLPPTRHAAGPAYDAPGRSAYKLRKDSEPLLENLPGNNNARPRLPALHRDNDDRSLPILPPISNFDHQPPPPPPSDQGH